MRPQIDETFRAWLPEQLPEVVEGLRASIAEDGVREPLIVWEETGLLVDGHTRLAIAEELGVAYETVKKSFASKEDALAWMLDNNKHRRNMTPVQLRLLRAKVDAQYTRKRGAQHGNKNAAKNETDSVSDSNRQPTRADVAKAFGVSEKCIQRDRQFADALDVIEDADPELAQDVVTGKAPGELPRVKAAAAAVQRGEDPREVIRNTPKPGRGAKNMAAGVLKMLDTLCYADADTDAAMLWPYWSAEERRQVSDKIGKVVNRWDAYQDRLDAFTSNRQ